MKLLKRLLIAIVVLVVVVAVVGFFLPASYKVERSLVMQAKPEAIYAFVAKPSTWEDWSAWNKERDPGLERKFEGPEQGKGSKLSWKGPASGNGTFEVTAGDPATGIEYELIFEGTHRSTGVISLVPSPSGTKVTWTNEGDLGSNPFSRYLGLLMDRFMGPDFEKGLTKLKGKVEAGK